MRAFCADPVVWRRAFALWFGDEHSPELPLLAESSSWRIRCVESSLALRLAIFSSDSLPDTFPASSGSFSSLETPSSVDAADPAYWVHFTSSQRRAGLLHVVRAGHHALLLRLLAGGAFPDGDESRVDLGAAVFWACSNGRPRCLRALLDHCSEWNSLADQRGFGPLSHAARHGHSSVVRVLLDAGADPRAVHASSGHSPLWLAAARGHTAVVEMLLCSGADPASLVDGCSALEVAAQEGHLPVLRLLLDTMLQQRVQAQRHEREAARSPPRQVIADAAAVSRDLYPPLPVSGRVLHCATNRGHLHLVRHLLTDHRLLVETSLPWGARGVTPLFLACVNGSLPLVRLLLGAGADLELGLRISGITPLFAAASRGHLEVCRLLLDAGACPLNPLFSPLLVAVQNGHFAVAELLRQRTAIESTQKHSVPHPLAHLQTIL